MSYIHQMLVSRELGGAGMIALQLALAMRERKERVIAWLPGEGAAAARATELRIPWRLYGPEKAIAGSKRESMLCNLKIGSLLYCRAPGIVHVHSPLYYGALSLGLKIAGLKTIMHVHIEEDQKGLQWALRRPPDVIITCARFLLHVVRGALPERFRESQRIVAVPNSVDASRFKPGEKIPAKVKAGVSLKTPLVLMVANLAPHKGQETALRAAAILKVRGLRPQFWFAGIERDGVREYKARLQTLVGELGLLEQVRFLGQRHDIPELLRAADCLILPSTAEGLPLSVLEAQASKVPVLAAPTAGIPEVIAHKKTGFLIPADDPTAYADYLWQLFNNPVLSKEISEAAYAAILQKHTWKTYTQTIAELYQSLQ